MPEAWLLRKARGHRTHSTQVDLLPSRPQVYMPLSDNFHALTASSFDIWDEYTRRQYQAKAPHLNPYGEEEQPRKFRDFDIFQKIRVLHQLTVWTFWNPDRLRERMADHPHEAQQLEWVSCLYLY